MIAVKPYPGEMTGTSWPIGPATSNRPASPARPPPSRRQNQIMPFWLNPAKRAAAGAWPTTLT